MCVHFNIDVDCTLAFLPQHSNHSLCFPISPLIHTYSHTQGVPHWWKHPLNFKTSSPTLQLQPTQWTVLWSTPIRHFPLIVRSPSPSPFPCHPTVFSIARQLTQNVNTLPFHPYVCSPVKSFIVFDSIESKLFHTPYYHHIWTTILSSWLLLSLPHRIYSLTYFLSVKFNYSDLYSIVHITSSPSQFLSPHHLTPSDDVIRYHSNQLHYYSISLSWLEPPSSLPNFFNL